MVGPWKPVQMYSKIEKIEKLCHNLLYNTCITTGPDFFSSHNAQRSIFYLHFNCNLKVFMKKKKMKENATKKSENVKLCLYLNFFYFDQLSALKIG